MQYKKIVLELLQQQPKIYHHLLSKRMLLPTLDRHAKELKTNHDHWKDRLCRARPGSNQDQIASEALEIALWELEHGLRLEYPSDDREPLTLDGAMAFIRGHGPTA
jgi:hypothetical protein